MVTAEHLLSEWKRCWNSCKVTKKFLSLDDTEEDKLKFLEKEIYKLKLENEQLRNEKVSHKKLRESFKNFLHVNFSIHSLAGRLECWRQYSNDTNNSLSTIKGNVDNFNVFKRFFNYPGDVRRSAFCFFLHVHHYSAEQRRNIQNPFPSVDWQFRSEEEVYFRLSVDCSMI